MSEFKKEKNILQRLVKAREAVKRKLKRLKYAKIDADMALEYTFKPIVEPLNKLVAQQQSRMFHKANLNVPSEEKVFSEDSLDEYYEDAYFDEVKPDNYINQTLQHQNTTEFESAKSNFENNNGLELDYYDTLHDENNITSSDTNDSPIHPIPRDETELDKVYGVRQQDGEYLIGNTPISFGSKYVRVKDIEYPNTKGLMELLFQKQVDQQLVSTADKKYYHDILEATHAHRKRYDPSEAIKSHTSRKFSEIIAPMFIHKSGSGLLPRYKIARYDTQMDYVYWDDPNELVDRLRLLMAERSAGNPSHENEIQSIIEELREGGYIY